MRTPTDPPGKSARVEGAGDGCDTNDAANASGPAQARRGLLKLIVPPPIVFLLAMLASWATGALFPPSRFDIPLLPNIGLALFILAGLMVLLAGAGFVARGTTVSPHHPERTHSLVTDGLYAFSRNPMYLAMAIATLAAALVLGQPAGLVFLAIAVWYITDFQIIPEERVLSAKFGAEYDLYCSKVRRWI